MVRFACPRTAAAVLLCSLGLALPAAAQDIPFGTLREAVDAAALQPGAPAPHVIPSTAASPERRPSVLVPLYVSFSALQALDTHSTSRALDRGAVEANPLLKGVAGNQAAMLAIKAAGTASVIYTSEKMWKRNRKAALIFMVVSNSAMVWIVQHNYRAVR